MDAVTPSQRKIQWRLCDSFLVWGASENTFLCVKDSYALLGWNMYGRSNVCRGWVCTLTNQRGGLFQGLSYGLSAPLLHSTLSSRVLLGLVLWKPVLLVGSLLGSPAGGTRGRLQSLGEKALAPLASYWLFGSQYHQKEINPEYSLEGLMLKVSSNSLTS